MSSDLLLLAFRYLSNELPADELAAFEARLANDQTAREALAEAVELAGAVALLPANTLDVLPLPPPPSRSPRRMVIAASAACLAAGAALGMWWNRPAAPPSALAARVEPDSVVLAWSGLRQSGEIDLVSHTELLAWLDEPSGSLASDPLMSEASILGEDTLPPWLLEATSIREGSTPAAQGAREN